MCHSSSLWVPIQKNLNLPNEANLHSLTRSPFVSMQSVILGGPLTPLEDSLRARLWESRAAKRTR
jgi:hypothetical protein